MVSQGHPGKATQHLGSRRLQGRTGLQGLQVLTLEKQYFMIYLLVIQSKYIIFFPETIFREGRNHFYDANNYFSFKTYIFEGNN